MELLRTAAGIAVVFAGALILMGLGALAGLALARGVAVVAEGIGLL